MAAQSIIEAEKQDVAVREASSNATASSDPRIEVLRPYLQRDEAALVREIDFRVIPILFAVYITSFLDRVNISNALTLGLPADLHLKGQEANVALSIFFVPYIIFEILSNMVMRKLKPHVWLSGCILAFGIVMLCQGFVQSYSGLLATRFFLGLAEAGIFPGSFYVISFWYKREEAQRRFSVYWCSVLVATMFGGLLASAIAKMDGVRGYSSWRWVFILEGLLTIALSVVAFFWISDFPEDVHWLSKEEKQFVAARVGTDHEVQSLRVADVLLFFTDIKNILGGLMFFATVVPIYSFAYFTPTIVRTLGYGTVQTQLHTVPPVAAALAVCLITAYLSDLTRLRSPYLIFCSVLTFTGLGILFSVHGNFHVQYAAVCLVTMGAFAGVPIIICWFVMNLQGHKSRSIGTAWIISFGNTGGIVATFSFLARDAPTYRRGYAICIGATCLGAAATLTYLCMLLRANRRQKVSEIEDRVERYVL